MGLLPGLEQVGELRVWIRVTLVTFVECAFVGDGLKLYGMDRVVRDQLA